MPIKRYRPSTPGQRHKTVADLSALTKKAPEKQLLTPNRQKCVDPRDHNAGVNPPDPNHPISKFRTGPPLAEADFE